MASTPSPNTPNDDSDFGTFVESDDECEVESDAEPRGRYKEGLYFPFCIGGVILNRYRIEHKLG